ncbi:MAG: hypothetical protein ABEN55_08990 [Bradymonadaceae bacterium]
MMVVVEGDTGPTDLDGTNRSDADPAPDGTEGGDGDAEQCSKGADGCGGTCEPKSCEQLGAECGSADDGCGGVVECGSCTGKLTCGGAGDANVCGAECRAGSPDTYTCNGRGVCTGGNPQQLVVDVETASVSANVQLDGEAPTPTDVCGDDRTTEDMGAIRFRRLDTDGSYLAALPCDGSDAEFYLPHGEYRVVVRGNASNLPDRPTVVRESLTVDGDEHFSFNIETVEVSATVQVDGSPLEPTDECDRSSTRGLGAVTLTRVGASGGASGELPCDGSAVDLRVPRGEYRVQSQGGQSNLPFLETRVRESLTVDGDKNLTFNVPVADVSATVQVDGSPLEPGDSCQWDDTAALAFVELTRADTGKSVDGKIPCDGSSLQWRLPYGEYRVDVKGGESNLPGLETTVRDSLTIDGDEDLTFDIPTAPVTATVQVDGSPPEPAETCRASTTAGPGVVTFKETKFGRSIDVELPCDGAGARQRLPHGEYEVEVEGRENSNIPALETSVREAWTVDGEKQLDVNIQTAQVSATFQVNGSAVEATDSCDTEFGAGLGEVEVTRTDTGTSVGGVLPCDGSGLQWRLPHGEYRVEVIGDRSNLPDLEAVVRDALTVDGDKNLTFDVPTVEVSTSIHVDGSPAEATDDCEIDVPQDYGMGVFRWTNAETGRSRSTELSCDGSAVRWRLPKGNYHLELRGDNSNIPGLDFYAIPNIEL